ncbi:hypothetical protein TKK_0000802 [Trichogramma kaykai]
MKFSNNYRLFVVALEDNDGSWYDNEEWAEEAKKISMSPRQQRLSLYDLTRSSPRQAAKLLACKDILRFGELSEHRNTRACWTLGFSDRHLTQKMSRRFFESWAL